jgi:hypothetical protein
MTKKRLEGEGADTDVFEVYVYDLKQETQKRLATFMGFKSIREMIDETNWAVFPCADIPHGEDIDALDCECEDCKKERGE